MIKLFSLKQQKKDGEAPKAGGNKKSFTAAQLRITKGREKKFPYTEENEII
jgi:ubiquitin-conjugating enzyme E2 M